MVVQWLSRPHRPGFDPQTLHSFLVLFHLIKVVRLKILVEEEGGHRVDVGIYYLTTFNTPFCDIVFANGASCMIEQAENH